MVRQHNRTETRNCGQTHFSGDESACLGWQNVAAVYNWQYLFPSQYFLPQPLGKGRETYKHVHSGDKGPHGKNRELIKDRCGLISLKGWENPCCWKEWWKFLLMKCEGRKLEAHSFASWSVETPYPESDPVLPPTPHLPWPYSVPTIYFKHPDTGPWYAPCPLALHITWLPQIAAVSAQIPSCSKALPDHPAEIACPTPIHVTFYPITLFWHLIALISLWNDLIYLLLWTCFVSRFLHQSIRSRKAGLASLRLNTISPLSGTVPGKLEAQNICEVNSFLNEWESLQVRRY